MKRSSSVLAFFLACVLLLLPATVCASPYLPGDTDISVSVDDSIWYVFTRENIENNPELDELGIAYNTIHSVFYDNGAYLDALLFFGEKDYVEFLIYKEAGDADDPVQMSNYSDKEIQQLGERLAKETHAENPEIVQKGTHKFIELNYYASELEYYTVTYYTIVNRQYYTLTFQSPTQFTQDQKDEIAKVMDTVSFRVDLSLKEPKGKDSDDSVLTGAIGGAIGGAVLGGISALVAKNKKKKQQKAAEAAAAGSPEIP
jgi:hypothetical protein